jgi:SAM-dependent methyltransferase
VELDWGDGDYSRTAVELAPAAEVLLDAVGPGPGTTLLDVACGTGNAALAAARRGAAATGVDSSERLVGLARERAAAEGIDARFAVGDAARLPSPDAAFDRTVSVFGVIFAPAAPALAEMARVTRPGGRVALTSWTTGGAITAASRILREAVGPPPGAPARWDDPAWVADRLAEAGLVDIDVTVAALAIAAPSPEAWLAEAEAHHPTWRAGRRALGEGWARVHAAMLAALREGNEDAAGFRTTSRYLVVTASR